MQRCLLLFVLLSQAVLASADLVSFNSPEGQTIFRRAEHLQDYFDLSVHYEPQENSIFCGPASATIVLNSLFFLHDKTSSLPQAAHVFSKDDLKYIPEKFTPHFQRFTQSNIFEKSPKSRALVLGEPKGEKSDFGFQLRQFHELMLRHQVSSTVRVVSDKNNDEKTKQELIKTLKEPGRFAIVNYARKSLGQTGGGHISPLGGYDSTSDRFLIMDVNPNRAPWVWVKSQDLINAMKTFDTVENRGYLLVKMK